MSEVTFTDADGTVRLRGTLDPPSSGLPTGWTQDELDPANVSTNGGRLMGGPSSTLELRGGDLTTPGDLDLVGGTSDGDAGGGSVLIAAGGGTATANGGEVIVRGGASDAGGNAGQVTVTGGQGVGANDNGGDVTIQPGDAVQGGDGGSVTLRDSGGAAVVRVDDVGLSFFNASTVARPEIAAIATAQGIVDALVSLGLVTQAV